MSSSSAVVPMVWTKAVDPECDPHGTPLRFRDAGIRNDVLVEYRDQQPFKFELLDLAIEALEDPAYIFRCTERIGAGASDGWCYTLHVETFTRPGGEEVDIAKFVLLVLLSPTHRLCEWRLELADPTDTDRPADYDDGRFTNPSTPWTRKAA